MHMNKVSVSGGGGVRSMGAMRKNLCHIFAIFLILTFFKILFQMKSRTFDFPTLNIGYVLLLLMLLLSGPNVRRVDDLFYGRVELIGAQFPHTSVFSRSYRYWHWRCPTIVSNMFFPCIGVAFSPFLP